MLAAESHRNSFHFSHSTNCKSLEPKLDAMNVQPRNLAALLGALLLVSGTDTSHRNTVFDAAFVF